MTEIKQHNSLVYQCMILFQTCYVFTGILSSGVYSVVHLQSPTERGRTITMSCDFPKTFPNINITWTYNNNTDEQILWSSFLVKDDNGLILSVYHNEGSYRDKITAGSFQGTGVHRIELSHVTERDEGEYSCTVENHYNTTRFSEMLHVTGKICEHVVN